MRKPENRDANDDFVQFGGSAIRKALSGAVYELEVPVPAIDPAIDFTEKYAAEIWAGRARATWRYDHGIGKWFEFVGTHWKKDGVRGAFHTIAELSKAGGRTKKGSPGTTGRAGFVRGVEAFAQADPRIAVEHDVWNCDPFALGTPGGTVDLRTGKVAPSIPAQMISQITAVAPEPGEPTRWLQFLDEATGQDPEMIRYLQQVLGYTLTGDTREHALFFIYGAGKNGKSVFLNTAARILGDYSTTATMDTFAQSRGDRHTTELARLDGARMVSASETEEGRAWAEARIKQLTGGDRIAARFMRQDNFEFTPRFKLIIVGNHQPALHNVDPATRRRFHIVPFTNTPPRPDLELERRLEAEHGRILSWMIEGCLDWQRNGLIRPAAVIAATDEYFEAQDMLGQWIAEACTTSERKWETPASLFRSWSDFARANGEEASTAKAFGTTLEKRGFLRGKTNGIRIHRGISVKPAADHRDGRDG